GLDARGQRVVLAATPETLRIAGDLDFVDQALDAVDVRDAGLRQGFQLRAADLAGQQHHAVVHDDLDVVVVAHQLLVPAQRVDPGQLDVAVRGHRLGRAAIVGDVRRDQRAGDDGGGAALQEHGGEHQYNCVKRARVEHWRAGTRDEGGGDRKAFCTFA